MHPYRWEGLAVLEIQWHFYHVPLLSVSSRNGQKPFFELPQRAARAQGHFQVDPTCRVGVHCGQNPNKKRLEIHLGDLNHKARNWGHFHCGCKHQGIRKHWADCIRFCATAYIICISSCLLSSLMTTGHICETISWEFPTASVLQQLPHSAQLVRKPPRTVPSFCDFVRYPLSILARRIWTFRFQDLSYLYLFISFWRLQPVAYGRHTSCRLWHLRSHRQRWASETARCTSTVTAAPRVTRVPCARMASNRLWTTGRLFRPNNTCTINMYIYISYRTDYK